MRVQVGDVTVTHDGTALAPYLRVTWDGSAIAAASNAVRGHGTIEHRVLSGDLVATLVPFPAGGTRKMVAAAAFAKGAVIYAAASGQVDDSGTVTLGVAMEGASGAGSIVEVLEMADQVQ